MKKSHKHNMKFADGEVVYAYYRNELTLATILGSRIVSNMYGPCSHLYTVRLTSSKKETLEVELDELAVFRHATFVEMEEKSESLIRQVETLSALCESLAETEGKTFQRLASIRSTEAEIVKIQEQVQKHCDVQRIPVPKEIECSILEYAKLKVLIHGSGIPPRNPDKTMPHVSVPNAMLVVLTTSNVPEAASTTYGVEMPTNKLTA